MLPFSKQPSKQTIIHESEMEFTAVRSQGAGGQNVNKVASAIHLRFDIGASSLPERVKERLLKLKDHRITDEGLIIIKAQRHRTQEMNKQDAIDRLHELVQKASVIPRKRKATKPTKASREKRMESKTKQGQVKALRKKVEY